MRITLKGFQEQAVPKLVRHLRGAARDSRSGDLQAVCLSSPTGSGKTVMLTAAIELLLEGDGEHAPLQEATFLWITDQPELNVQTRRKMLSTSSVLSGDRLVVIESSFNQETLHPGTVHFLNTQKLGKDKGLVKPGDKRDYSIWETIRNTIDSQPGTFFVIIDEAHRGMTEGAEQAEAATIIQKFIKGSSGELPAVPVIVGISATPERFNRLIVGTGRMSRPVDVEVQGVRDSGLIKDTIILHHPKKEQLADMTMLREAARALKAYTEQWSSYCSAQEEFEIVPLLVVQVEDAANKGQISQTDLPQAIRILRDVLGMLPNDAFAHSFQEQAALKIGGEEVRYLAPSDIQEDASVRVVFFKTSLNTGWDCPRAEVMMSFRTAADATYIAQLVGRMVRTPLARRVVDNEVLNTVALYLPHYDADKLAKIIAKLSKPDDNSPPMTDVERGEDVVDLHKALGSEKYFTALSALPSYVVPRRRKVSQVHRLKKLARLLTNDELNEEALSDADEVLLGVLNAEYSRVKCSKQFEQIVERKEKIEVETVNWDVGTEDFQQGKTIKVDIASENVEDLFEATGRKLSEGLHKAWWRERVKADPTSRERAKLELFALCIDPDLTRRIERAAQETVQSWLQANRAAINKLEEGRRLAYAEVRNLAASPELDEPIVYPGLIQGRRAEKSWDKHLYVADDGTFAADFNKWEREVLENELLAEGSVAWLRNIDRKPWALCVNYEVDGEDRSMYPDFLFIRLDDGKLIVDLIDPHSIALADAPAKAAGLAKFAAKHAEEFGKIELIMLGDNNSKRLNLCDETVRSKVRGITTADQLKKLFNEP